MGFLDKIIRFFEELTGGVKSETIGYTRKFVAGLQYCGGKKRTAFALTFEANDIDREQELLNAIEETNGAICSEIRFNFGYSEEDGFFSPTFEYPEIEVGFE